MTTHNTHNKPLPDNTQHLQQTSTWQHTTFTTDKHPCHPVGFVPTIPARKRSQTYVLVRAATGTGIPCYTLLNYSRNWSVSNEILGKSWLFSKTIFLWKSYFFRVIKNTTHRNRPHMTRPIWQESNVKPHKRNLSRPVLKVSSHFEYLENRSRCLDVTWQSVRGDLTARPWTFIVPWG